MMSIRYLYLLCIVALLTPGTISNNEFVAKKKESGSKRSPSTSQLREDTFEHLFNALHITTDIAEDVVHMQRDLMQLMHDSAEDNFLNSCPKKELVRGHEQASSLCEQQKKIRKSVQEVRCAIAELRTTIMHT